MPDLSIPQNDKAFASWAGAFARTIKKNPSAYGLSPPDAELLDSVVSEYVHALGVVGKERSRNKVTIAEKNSAKIAAMQAVRQYVRMIQVNNGISDAEKIALGLHIRSGAQTRRHVPQSSPVLSYIGSTPTSHTLTFRDSFATSRRKPYGASGLQVFAAIADEMVCNVNEARYVGEYSSSPFAVSFEPQDARKVVSYFARWIGHRKDVGPWSLPVHAVVPWVGGSAGRSDEEEDDDGESDALRRAA